MVEQPFVVSDVLWARLGPYLPGMRSDSGVTAKDNSQFRRFSPLGRGGCFRVSFQSYDQRPRPRVCAHWRQSVWREL